MVGNRGTTAGARSSGAREQGNATGDGLRVLLLKPWCETKHSSACATQLSLVISHPAHVSSNANCAKRRGLAEPRSVKY